MIAFERFKTRFQSRHHAMNAILISHVFILKSPADHFCTRLKMWNLRNQIYIWDARNWVVIKSPALDVRQKVQIRKFSDLINTFHADYIALTVESTAICAKCNLMSLERLISRETISARWKKRKGIWKLLFGDWHRKIHPRIAPTNVMSIIYYNLCKLYVSAFYSRSMTVNVRDYVWKRCADLVQTIFRPRKKLDSAEPSPEKSSTRWDRKAKGSSH